MFMSYSSFESDNVRKCSEILYVFIDGLASNYIDINNFL